ncbi:signal peptidase II [endosymbiont of unidentified scaly snail isolate Monju]|uniref:signal peptidase II n=1 Tax=endosymbiont of unidentified scaly snail isolate Monju TaxID=1248727 RepID=UPI0003892973|nr:signal peptidase II [endosymbiont of unidentified scaly snail isolate Monju]BAN68532.1 signal peptidase II [endosymbiont of unidentified scaly snail isolate Monju]
MRRFLWLALAVALIDQGSKYWILGHFREYEVLTVWPVFNLTLVYNRGAAFSFLADAGGWQHYLFVGLALMISVLLVVWLWRLPPERRLEAWGLSLVLGGALGNLVDRLVHGRVVDFLQWHWEEHYFPSFNLADSAITLGVILLLIDALRGRADVR